MKINGATVLSALATTTNYVLKQSSTAGTLINSQIFDNGTNVGIGTTSPSYKFQVNKSESGSNPSAVLRLENTGANYTSKLTLTDGTTNDANISYLGATQSLGFGVGSSLNQMVLTSIGNVGIGTSSPSTKLHVTDVNKTFDGYGNVNIFTSDAAAIDKGGSLAFGGVNATGGTSPYVFAKIQGIKEGSAGNYNGTLIFGTTSPSSAVTEKMRITSIGNVGIGTSSPASLLHINNPNTNPNALTVGNNNNGAIYGCTTGGNPIIGNYTGDLPIQFGYFSGGISTTFTERMRINSGGNVGIGTTSPSSILHLSSSVPFLSIQGSTTGSLRGINIMQGSTVFSSLSAEASLGETRLSAGFSGWGGFQTFYTNGSEKMRITAAGNVGIGTTSPSGNAGASRVLQVEGSFDTEIQSKGSGAWIRANSTNTFQGGFGGFQYYQNGVENFGIVSSGAGTNTMLLTTGGSERMRITSGGNVGIGTTSPSTKLQVNGDIASVMTGPAGNTGMYKFGDGSTFILGATTSPFTSGFISFELGYSEKMRITSNGNVGIGTSSPEACALLHVDTTEKGFLPPRMRTGDRDNIGGPVSGLMIFNTDDEVVQVYTNGSGWRTLAFL